MKSKTWLVFSVAAAVLSGLTIGCGNGAGKGNSVNNGVAGTCTIGTVYIAEYAGCYATAQCATSGPNYGYVPQIGQCRPGIATGGAVVPGVSGRHLWAGVMVQTNAALYRQLIKDAGVCGGGHWNAWSGRGCDQWDDYSVVNFEVYGSGVIPASGTGTIIATAESDYGQEFWVPLTYHGHVLPMNVNTGFGLEAMNYNTGYNKKVRFEGNVGSLLNGTTLVTSVRLRVLYQGQEVGYSDVTLRY